MDHVAIMRKAWGFTEKIVSGEKIIESRWYKAKYSPWGKIMSGDEIYFKNSGQAIFLKTGVKKVIAFENLNPNKVWAILDQYGKDIGILEIEMPKYFEMFKDKKYCLLIFLEKVQRIDPFDINKKGFGNMASWICVEDVEKIRKT